ncbi:MAG: hypothetical protein JWO86_2304 [Myxococcaceae bacterium]|nr:hypothetical protein [Myxococcaceae bacterium]
MTPLPPDWRGFFEALLAARVEFVVIGALAVAAHAEPRFTEDLDVLVRPVRSNGVRLRKALASFGFEAVAPAADEITDLDRVWMLGRKPFRIDILTGISGVTWKDVHAGRIQVEIDGLVLPVIGRNELIANKRASGRPKDLLDLDMLARTEPRKRAHPKLRARPAKRTKRRGPPRT